jgi:hypothetical protein
VFEKESGDKSPHSTVLDCGALRVAFDWRGDRYGHRVEQQIGGEWRPALESVEGSTNEDWPPGPPLQSLHIERRGAGHVALLVGKAGISHWSASIEPIGSRSAIQFDIACRIQRPPGRLGSIYRLARSSDQPIVQVAALPQDAICQFVEHQEMSSWHIRPLATSSEHPCTIRWRYTISLDNRSA